MSHSQKLPISGWICLWGVITACSLQMPKEDELFAPEDGRSGGAAGSTSTSQSATGGREDSTGAGGRAASGGMRASGGASGGSTSGAGTGNVSDGLVAHYPFDETTGEVAANLIDATKNGRYVGACTHPTGRRGGAVGIRNLVSTSTSEWIELPVGLLSKLSATTLMLWVRDLSTAREGGRLFHFSAGATEEIYFAPDQVNPATSLAGGHLGGTHTGTPFVDLWSTTPVMTDKDWHQVAIAWSAVRIDLYIDGSPAGRKENPGVVPSALGATSPNWLGRTLNDEFIALYAEMDDLRVYDRVLTAAEIAQLYRLR